MGLFLGCIASALHAAAAPDPAAITARPLARPSGAGAGPLFTNLPAETTGIVAANAYDDPTMWWELHQEFKFGAIGSGVAIGDLDTDGRPDLYIVNKTTGGRLFRNLGNWRFADVTESAGLAGPTAGFWEQGVAWARQLFSNETATATAKAAKGIWHQGAALADINNDGHLDVYVCRFGAPNLLFINQGDGTFREEAAARGVAISDASNMAAFADFDRDGWLDFYLQTNLLNVGTSPTGQRDYLLRNRGDGTFVDVTDAAGITGRNQGHSATWWDYNEDGWPDLYVANDFAPPDQLYQNNRDGTFTNVIAQVVPTMPHSAMGADLGDVNNDGRIDLLVADMAATTREKDQRTMARIRSLLNEAAASAGEAPQFMRNTLFLNTGAGVMLEAGILAGLEATDWTWSVRLEDLDNDGWLDAFFTNGMVRELHNADLVQRISATEAVAEGVRLLRESPPLREPNLAFRNRGDLRFEPVGEAWGLDQKGVSFGAAFGDLDGDGDLDLVTTNYEDPPTVLRNESTAGHRLVVALRGTRSNRFGVGAVVEIETGAGRQVRRLVAARGYLSSSEPILHFGLGPHDRVDRLTVRWPSGHEQVFTELAADQHYTITEPAAAPPAPTAQATNAEPRWFEPLPATSGLQVPVPEAPVRPASHQPLLPFRQHQRGPAAAAGDLNGDGREEIVIGGTTAQPAQVLSSGNDGRWTRRPLPGGREANDGPILMWEANGDGQLDLLVTKSGAHQPADSPAYQPQLLLNDGDGNFTPAPEGTLPPLPISAGAATAADFDRDGHLDLFIGGRVRPGEYPLPARSALLQHRDGRWIDVTADLAPGLQQIGLVTSALWTDVDSDGWIDLLLALEWGTVRYWRNEQGQGFTDASDAAGFSAAGAGWWNSLAAGDFNTDGRLDYLAGNAGLNTPYSAHPDAPVTLLYGTARPGGRALILEALVEDGRLYPRRGRNELAPHLPGLMRRYPRNDDFARATWAEILGEDTFAAARRFTATELRSGVFLSRPDGTHRFTPLPGAAQIAPAQGLVTLDFDGDGHLDAYVLHNSHAPIPSLGRFAGGGSQLLRGDGRGGFTAVPFDESGLLITGDAKAAISLALDEDAWPDLFITRNDGESVALRHRGSPSAAPLQITLQGSTGNPSSIGTRLEVVRTDGTVVAHEVSGGGGYMSQSGARLTLARPESNPPRLVRVRWPDGKTTEQIVPAGATSLTLSAPAP